MKSAKFAQNIKTLLLYFYKVEKNFHLKNMGIMKGAKGSNNGNKIVFTRFSSSKKYILHCTSNILIKLQS